MLCYVALDDDNVVFSFPFPFVAQITGNKDISEHFIFLYFLGGVFLNFHFPFMMFVNSNLMRFRFRDLRRLIHRVSHIQPRNGFNPGSAQTRPDQITHKPTT